MRDEVDDTLTELVESLRIEPRRDIAADVRARLAQRPVRIARSGSWYFGVAAVAAVTLILFARAAWRTREYGDPAPRPAAQSAADRDEHVRQRLSAPSEAVPSRAIHARERREQPSRMLAAYDNVLVPDDQARAVDRLLARVRSGAVIVPAANSLPLDKDGLLLAPEPVRIVRVIVDRLPPLDPDSAEEAQ